MKKKLDILDWSSCFLKRNYTDIRAEIKEQDTKAEKLFPKSICAPKNTGHNVYSITIQAYSINLPFCLLHANLERYQENLGRDLTNKKIKRSKDYETEGVLTK